MNCPKCGFQQQGGDECQRCGVIFSRMRPRPVADPVSDDVEVGDRRAQSGYWLSLLLEDREVLHIDQHALHWWEILLNWEQANEYMIRDQNRRNVGVINEKSAGLLNALIRNFLKSHRPLDIEVLHYQSHEMALVLERDFFFFFSEMDVTTPEGQKLGCVRRRFGLLYKKYDLIDQDGRCFARIHSPIWRLWTFPVKDLNGDQVAVITKKWNGLGKEVFTDADTFTIDFGQRRWSLAQKAVLFAAALSIDFDFFENNN